MLLEQRYDRVIALIDMNCFYAQVEMKKHSIPPTVPLAVKQWGLCLAVNYAARKYGIGARASVAEARQKCPDIVMIDVDLLPMGGGTTTTLETSSSSTSASSSTGMEGGKVTLERYRIESGKIYGVLHKLAANCERASIDEFFIDLTEQVDKELAALPPGFFLPHDGDEPWTDLPYPSMDRTNRWSAVDTVLGADPLALLDSHQDRRLWLGARMVLGMRKAILDQLGYTTSAGIAHNKLLAKLCAGHKKPGGQTALPLHSVPQFLGPLQFTKLRGAGGKLGYLVCNTFNAQTCQQVAEVPWQLLQQSLGGDKTQKQARMVYRLCRGVCDEPVQERSIIKSFASSKQFPTCNDPEVLSSWLCALASEIASRTQHERDENRRVPSKLVLGFCISPILPPGVRRSREQSRWRSVALSTPSFSSKHLCKLITDVATGYLHKHIVPTLSESVGCSSLSLNASGFIAVSSPALAALFCPTEPIELHTHSAPTSPLPTPHPPSPKKTISPLQPKKPISSFFSPLTFVQTQPNDQPNDQPSDHPRINPIRDDIQALGSPSIPTSSRPLFFIHSSQPLADPLSGDRTKSSFFEPSFQPLTDPAPPPSAKRPRTDEGRFKCPRCKKHLPQSDRLSHLDAHHANALRISELLSASNAR
ncbi:MAG: hypothetical protein Q8P67_02495 [archaeon]|nr:hypothetical protein [archaeon]